jgi:hypothetical protein
MNVSVKMSDNGYCFLSYKRERASDIEKLAKALGDRGVPVWQDVRDLQLTHTEVELRNVLSDPCTGSALLFITPEVRQSAMVCSVEAPSIINRAVADQQFFAVPVAAGGLDYEGAAAVSGDVRKWSIRKLGAA